MNYLDLLNYSNKTINTILAIIFLTITSPIFPVNNLFMFLFVVVFACITLYWDKTIDWHLPENYYEYYNKQIYERELKRRY